MGLVFVVGYGFPQVAAFRIFYPFHSVPCFALQEIDMFVGVVSVFEGLF